MKFNNIRFLNYLKEKFKVVDEPTDYPTIGTNIIPIINIDQPNPDQTGTTTAWTTGGTKTLIPARPGQKFYITSIHSSWDFRATEGAVTPFSIYYNWAQAPFDTTVQAKIQQESGLGEVGNKGVRDIIFATPIQCTENTAVTVTCAGNAWTNSVVRVSICGYYA